MNGKHVYTTLVGTVLLTLLAGCAGSHSGSGGTPGLGSSDTVTGETPGERAVFQAFTREEDEFRRHYNGRYAGSGYAYNQVRPAYQHGFEFGYDGRYRDREWTAVEDDARRRWDESRLGSWDRYRDAVRFGWERGVLASRG